MKRARVTIGTGLITGVSGAVSDLGGIFYLLIARDNGTHYAKVLWVVGIGNLP